jgi:hypothetical protein
MTARVTLGATIPTTQYGNLQPSFEIEGETTEAALEEAVVTMQRFWNSVSDKPLNVRELETAVFVPPTTVDLTCWASGTVVQFDPVEHRYSPGKWLSGSAFASRYTPDFPAEMIAGKMATKAGLDDPAEILAMWALNAEASSTFGTSVHAALELYGRFLATSQAVKGSNESALTKNPILRPIVESFFAGREDEAAAYEAFVADPVLRHCGQIDRLKITGPRSVRVQDFKSNATLDDKETIKAPFKGVVESTKLGAYWLQLSFYAAILIRLGYTVEGLDIFHLQADGSWVTHSHDVVDITGVI